MTEAPLLEVADLEVHFPIKTSLIQEVGREVFRRLQRARDFAQDDRLLHPRVHAVDGISFRVGRGEILGLVGESGCGKTTTGRAVLRLLEPTAGRIVFEGEDITHWKEDALRPIRRRMQIVFQDPHAALNPAMTIGQAIMDALLLHETQDPGEAREASLRVMDEVGLTPAEDLFAKYPVDLSGGQKQRAVLARAIVLRPSLLVADEPVAMLDMSIRARTLELLLELRDRYGMAYLFITHDLATAKFVCDRIAIMYLGRIVEIGPTDAIFRNPKHPYTRALLAAIPIPQPGRARERTLPRGEVPDAIFPPAGCRFHPRCPVALPTCGWEGHDFVEYLDQRRLDPKRAAADKVTIGEAEDWRSDLFEARGRVRDQDSAAVASYVRSILLEAAEPMRNAVLSVEVDRDDVVVRFRNPESLLPKAFEGRTVECLLY